MDRMVVKGGKQISGKVRVSGAKNAALPLMAACLLSDETLTLSNVPHLADISTMANLLMNLGVDLTMDGGALPDGFAGKVLRLNAGQVVNMRAPYEIVRKMRASVVVLGPLLARFGRAEVSMPGGCAIGTRPIDQHLKVLEAMGARIELAQGYIIADAPKGLHGAEITFDKVTVGGTQNALMAATLAQGRTILHNAAREPEISDLANCLNAMGAQISGIGDATLIIEGVKKLQAAHHAVLPDRIEAGTYLVAGAMTRGNILVEGIDPAIMGATLEVLKSAGIKLELQTNAIRVISHGEIKPIDVETQPYPGLATDMQAQCMALATLANGTSHITETIFENRFMHVPELNRMGADIHVEGHTAIIKGVQQLKSAEVMATDLRASVAMILAGLAAEGTTIMHRIYHLDRGYEQIEEKLSHMGAQIFRLRD